MSSNKSKNNKKPEVPGISQNKKLKIFNKILKEFLNQCNCVKGPQESRVMFKAESASIMNTFRQECDFIFDSFINCDSKVIQNITLCKKADLDKTIDNLSTENSKSVWGYLHNLYIVCVNGESEINLEEIVGKSKESIGLINKDFVVNDTASAPFGKDLGSIIEEISKKVSGQLESNCVDEEIDPMALMSRLMSGEENVTMGGVDFSKILRDTTESIQGKINTGEINIDVLKNQTMGLLSSVPGVSEKLSEVLTVAEPLD